MHCLGCRGEVECFSGAGGRRHSHRYATIAQCDSVDCIKIIKLQIISVGEVTLSEPVLLLLSNSMGTAFPGLPSLPAVVVGINVAIQAVSWPLLFYSVFVRFV